MLRIKIVALNVLYVHEISVLFHDNWCLFCSVIVTDLSMKKVTHRNR